MQKGGGIFVAFGLIVGAVVGTLLGESSLGVAIGLGAGVVGAILLGLWDARRRG